MEFEIDAVGKGSSLSGASIYRSNGDWLRIEGSSTDPLKLPLSGATLELEIKNYSTGVAVLQASKATTAGGDNSIEVVSQTPESITAYCKLVPADFTSITATGDVELVFKLDVTCTPLAHPITVLEGKFTSTPDML